MSRILAKYVKHISETSNGPIPWLSCSAVRNQRHRHCKPKKSLRWSGHLILQKAKRRCAL